MKDILQETWMIEMIRTLTNMYNHGWDERNGGNVSMLLDEEQVADCLDTGKVIRRLRTSNKRRFKQRLKKFQKLYSQGDITTDKIKMSRASYNGHLRHGHTWKLKKKAYGKFVLTRNIDHTIDKE